MDILGVLYELENHETPKHDVENDGYYGGLRLPFWHTLFILLLNYEAADTSMLRRTSQNSHSVLSHNDGGYLK